MNVAAEPDELWLDTASLLSLGNMRHARRALEAGALQGRLRWCGTVDGELAYQQRKRDVPKGTREAMGLRRLLGDAAIPTTAQEAQIERIQRQLAQSPTDYDKHWGEAETAVLAVDSHTELSDQKPDGNVIVLAASDDTDMPVALKHAQEIYTVKRWTTVHLLAHLVAAGHLTCDEAWEDYRYAIDHGDRPLEPVTKQQLCGDEDRAGRK